MSDFYDAFQELKGLDEATFSFDKPGILALKKYINDDGEEETTTITVTDPSAETVDDMKYDYDGEVILKCSICGGLISKEPSQVKVDEQTQLANVEEECPYCYNVGGYEVVGEVKVPETLEYEEVDEFGDRTNDTKVVEFDDDTLDDAVTESYELHSGTVVKCFSDHDKAEKYANSKGYELAEYGNLGGGIGGDFAYAYWNETGDRNDDELVIAYYAFDDDGKARPLTEREKRYIAQEQVVEFDDDTLDVDSDNITVENKPMAESLNEGVSVGKLAKFIEEAVEGLKDGEGTNYRYKFDDRFALFVGWLEGYDEDDDAVIHDEKYPEFAIVAGIKVWTSDDMWTDFEWLNFPYYENGDVIDDMQSISPEEDYHRLAQDFLDDYNDDYKDLKVTKDGLVVEHDDDEESPYQITYYYDASFDYDNSDAETYDTFEEVKDVFNSRKNDDGVFAIEVENNDGDIILSYSKDGTKNESLDEDVSDRKGDFTDLFVNFLYSTEFALDKDEDGYYLVDLQGANLGNINKDRFQSAEEIFDRMEVYIEDYFVDDLEDWAEYYKIELPGSYEEMLHFIDDNDEYPLTDNEKYSYEVLDMVVNHYDDIDLEKALKSFNKNVNESTDRTKDFVVSIVLPYLDTEKNILDVPINFNKEIAPRGYSVWGNIRGSGFFEGDITYKGRKYPFKVENGKLIVYDRYDLYQAKYVGGKEYTKRTAPKINEDTIKTKDGKRANVIEFPSGDYVYVGFEKGKLFAGSATNNGIIHDYEMDIDGEEPTDAELQDMYDMIVDKHPEYLEESCKKDKRRLKEQISDSAYEVAEILEKEFGNKEKVSMDEFDRAFGRATKKVLGDKEPDEDFETDVRSILSMSGFETEFEGDNEGGLSRLGESCKKGRKKIDESVKIISTLDEYTPWSGAKNTYETIVDAGKIDDLDAYLEDIYPEGLTVTELNDLLWFDGDSVLSDLGIYTEDAIDTAIQDAVDEAQGESFEYTDELESFLTNRIEDAMRGVSVSVDIYDEEVEITVENTTRSFALTDFTVEEIEESLNESRSNSYTRVKGVEAEWYEKSTRNYNYEYVDLTIDGEEAVGKDRWINRPWYKFTFANAFKDAAKQLGYYEAAKEAVDAASSIEEAVKYFAEHYKEEKELTEAVDNIQITTDSDVANIDLNGSDSVNVSINPKEDGGDEEFVGDITDEPTIQPIDDETQAEIETNSEEESEEDGDSSGDETAEEEVDEFDETDFDELGESYLKSVYNNVESFKTTKGYLDKDKIKLEGIISFKSGKKAKTSFVFEGYSKTARGKYKMIGENLQLTSRKNAFILTGSVKNRKLCLEALTYNYSAKDAKSGKSVRVYGTKRVK